jgi:hypothetical protein
MIFTGFVGHCCAGAKLDASIAEAAIHPMTNARNFDMLLLLEMIYGCDQG